MSLRRLTIDAFIAAILLAQPSLSPAQGIITTAAGTTWILRGGGSATSAPLGQVVGVAVDRAGNVFASDGESHLVVKISPGGVLSIVAGNGIAGYLGDGGPATGASLSFPFGGVALDTIGNLYVADDGNNRIRKISPAGIITTVAGNGTAGYSGDGGPATNAGLNLSTVNSGGIAGGLAVDTAGSLYIADTFNNRIRKVSPGGIVTTLAGNGTSGYSGDGGPAIAAELNVPVGLAVDSGGNVYIADEGNNRIRKISPGGTITTVAGDGTTDFSGDGGPAVNAKLIGPSGVAVDTTGSLYVADAGNQRIRKISSGGIIATVAGSGPYGGGEGGFFGDGGDATTALLNTPQGVAVDAAGNLYIADSGNRRIRKIDQLGDITTVGGNGLFKFRGDGGPAVNASFNSPNGVAVDSAGDYYIADSNNNRVRKVSSAGIITTVAGNGTQGFSGDDGPATSASLNNPLAVAVDSGGNLYIADSSNLRVRKVTRGGIIGTVAGNGNFEFSGDGGLATAAALEVPTGVAVDAAGNLYIADIGNNRIRKVSSNGTIATAAGNGAESFSGDGGPATSASLQGPNGVAVDSAGNLYIADEGNVRVRKVTPSGIIVTVAGGGPNFPGDGGPATQGQLNYPRGVAVDAAGNLFIADTNNSRVRKVTADGIITTIAGSFNTGFSGDGGPATSARLDSPLGVAVDGVGNVYIADTNNDRIREVLVTPPSFTVSPQLLSFSASPGGLPSEAQSILISSPVSGIPFIASFSTLSGGAWLAASLSIGRMPSSLQVTADPSGLSPGAYTGTVAITAPNANPPVQTVAVTFNVTPQLPARLALQPNTLSFSFRRGSSAANAPVTVSNLGGGSLDFTASASAKSGGAWLSVSPASGTVKQISGVSLTVTANPANLDPGTYTGLVSIASSTTGETAAAAVTMTISAVQQTILLSQTGLAFTAVVANSGAVPPQTFGVLNTGQGVLAWSLSSSTLSGGNNWLSVTPASGSSDAASLQVPLVQVAVNPAGLAPGTYSGQVQVSAGAADNSPQIVSVILNVLPAGSILPPVVRPTGLIFTGVSGATSPGSQNVLVTNLSGGATSFTSGRLTLDGKDWFVNLPTNDTVAPSQSSRIVVQPDLTGLGTGIRRGALSLLFNDGSIQAVSLLFVLAPAGTVSSQGVNPDDYRPADSGCTPSTLLPLFTSLASNFTATAGSPTPVEVRVVDDCGNPLVTGSVVATFSNGDPPVTLARLGDGNWSATWQPRNPSASQTVTITANGQGQSYQGKASVGGITGVGQNFPVVSAGAVVSGAAFNQSPIAASPGGIISIFGTKLADAPNSASTLPLDTQLANTKVTLGGQPMPLLYASDGQINAQVPYGIPVNTTSQVMVQRGVSQSVPESVTVAAAQPAVFTADQSGKGQGLIFVGSSLADASNPAKAGDTVVIYCAGLGEVSPSVPAGSAAPVPPAQTSNPVTVTIGGTTVPAQFAGLAPGFAGLYQVNAVVPAGIAPDNAVPLTLSVAGQTSPPVTMAVQ